MKNFFPLAKNRKVKFCKFWGVSTNGFLKRNGSFIEVDQLNAYGSFLLKIGKDFIKNNEKRIGTKPPGKLMSGISIFAAIDKVNLATKSLQEPFENRSFSVVALKKNFIEKVFSVFGSITIDSKAAFCIYKTSQISEIFLGRKNDGASGFEQFFHFWQHKIGFVFLIVKGFNESLSVNTIRRGTKGSIQNGLFFFLNEIRKKIQDKIGFFTTNAKMKNRFVTGFGFFRVNNSAKRLFKPNHCFFNRGNNGKRGHKLATSFDDLLSKMKAAISVNISSGVSKLGFLNHTINDGWLGYLSQ